MSKNDLQKWVTSDVDFYALLGLTLTAPSSSELRRAYRKTALQYHPDKAGKDYDPEKYELFQAANGVLSDPELKAKYDGHRNAKLQRQRANELFEGKRRAMKEDLEERERGGAGSKRGREESEMDREMKKLAEEGRKRRAKRQSMMAENVASSPAPAPAPAPVQRKPEPAQTRGTTTPTPEMAPAGTHRDPVLVDGEEDAVESLERRIREAEAAKAKRKADKRARKSGVFVSLDSPAEEKPEGRAGMGLGRDETATATPIKPPDMFRGLKADEQSSASPKFSFSPTIPTPKRNDFAATMARLKAAEKQRMEDEIRKQESEAA